MQEGYSVVDDQIKSRIKSTPVIHLLGIFSFKPIGGLEDRTVDEERNDQNQGKVSSGHDSNSSPVLGEPQVGIVHDRIAELLLAGLPATTTRFRENEQDHDHDYEHAGCHQVLLELARLPEHGL